MALPISPKDPVPFNVAAELAANLRRQEAALRLALEKDPAEEVRAGLEKTLESVVAAAEKAEADAPERTTWLIRPATRRERIAFRRAATAAGARFPADAEIFAALRAGVRALAPEPQREALVAIVDALEAVAAGGEPLDEAAATDALSLIGAIREGWDPYRRLEADRAYWLQIAPVIAATMFLVGRQGDRPLARRGGVIPDELLEDVPDDELQAVGMKALGLMAPAETERKN